jgi:hypothetical protein
MIFMNRFSFASQVGRLSEKTVAGFKHLGRQEDLVRCEVADRWAEQ